MTTVAKEESRTRYSFADVTGVKFAISVEAASVCWTTVDSIETGIQYTNRETSALEGRDSQRCGPSVDLT